MKKSKNDWIIQFRITLDDINENQFSSHDFIGKFGKLYELEWKRLLELHEIDAKKKVNAYIAHLLSLYAQELHVRKMKGLKPSKNIHASTSRVHWWEKIATTLIILFVMASAVKAEEFNPRTTFLQHIKGWEWVYTEEGHIKQIKTPYFSATYKEYDSHPEYRVVFEDYTYEGLNSIYMTIYDTNGNLVRQLTEVAGWYKPGNNFSSDFKKGYFIEDPKLTGIRAKRLPLTFNSGKQKDILIDSLCHRQMATDYLNNMYDVKAKEGTETRMLIEKELGIQKDSQVHLDKDYKNAEKIKCETLGLPVDEKYYNMGELDIMKEIKKYHPQWTYIDIANKYKDAVQRIAIDIAMCALNVGNTSSTSSTSTNSTISNVNKKAAYNYINSLIDEYQFIVTDIQRIDATTFEATIEIAPRGTQHKITIHYRQTKPYECEKEIQIVS